MNEIIMFGLAIGGIFSFFATQMLVHMGKKIDRFPTEYEEERERSLWSPREFTRFATVFYWASYLTGAAMLIPGTRLLTVAGIVVIVGIVLFMVTALSFSIATYNLMRANKRGGGAPSAMKAPARSGRIVRMFSFQNLRHTRYTRKMSRTR